MSGGLLVVTGGAGFIGSHLVDHLVARGWRIRVVDNLSSGTPDNIKQHLESRKVEFLKLDLKSPEEAYEAVKGAQAVFHLAANPEVRVST
ncbi:MAG: SDR family NAD(P)-dependent oxidoreductase, partial [Thermofilaceae archaeon]